MSHIAKKGLAHCGSAVNDCRHCPYYGTTEPYGTDCIRMLASDALAYIETLEERLKEAQEVIPDGWLDHP